MLTILACLDASSDGSNTASTDGPTWSADVAPIVAANCTGCHRDGDIAPFPLTTYDEVAAVAGAVKAAVVDRRMPPWLASAECSDYVGDISLSDEDMATISAWVDAGMPEGAGELADAMWTGSEGGLTRVDHLLPMPVAYTPTASPDDYRCFAIDWPEAEDTWITGFDVAPDNTPIVHHLVAYLATPDQVAEYAELDDAHDGPGWQCFGGPGVGSQENATWLGGWAPGAQSGDFPNGTGIEIVAGSQIIVQMHYNTEEAAAGADQSSVAVMVADEVENPAYIQPWADPAWLDGDGMDIPAGAYDVSHGFSYTFGFGGFKIHTSNLHMHTLGTNAKLWIERADGAEECMLQIPRWDFGWQRTYVFDEPKIIETGDAIHIECQWDNPTDSDIDWGEGTGDEMCLGTMLLSY